MIRIQVYANKHLYAHTHTLLHDAGCFDGSGTHNCTRMRQLQIVCMNMLYISCLLLGSVHIKISSVSVMDTGSNNIGADGGGGTSFDQILGTAKPGTWLYSKILRSTPVLAGEIFTQHLTVKSRRCAYMTSEIPVVLTSVAAAAVHHQMKPASFSK